MKKLRRISKKETMDVYQLMAVHGVLSDYHKNIKVSSAIAEKKVGIRLKFDDVTSLKKVSHKKVRREDILRGHIHAVCDEYQHISFYENPSREHLTDLVTKPHELKELKKVREAILNEMGYVVSASGNITLKEDNEERYDDDNVYQYVTEKQNRLFCKRHYY